MNKPKRLARDFDREYALELVRLYRTQGRQRHRYKGREYEGFVVTGDTLAYELERFAHLGTWETPVHLVRVSPTIAGKYVPRCLLLRLDYDKLRSDGDRSLRAIGILAQKYNMSDQAVRDELYHRVRKKKSGS